MKVLKWVGVIVAVYVAFVVAFETLFLGLYQPKLERTGIPMLVITTTDDSGVSRERRLARFETDGKLYVSAHHWPRGWYSRTLENPNVRVEIDGAVADYCGTGGQGRVRAGGSRTPSAATDSVPDGIPTAAGHSTAGSGYVMRSRWLPQRRSPRNRAIPRA